MISESKSSSNILVPISIGELIDKITILEIKKINMTGIKLKNIEKELELLQYIIEEKNDKEVTFTSSSSPCLLFSV